METKILIRVLKQLYLWSSILAECETIPTEGNGTFSIQIPECQVNSTENLVMDNLTLSLENFKYLNISNIILPTVSEKMSWKHGSAFFQIWDILWLQT